MDTCERCDKDVPTVHEHHGLLLCESCIENANEAAYERMCDDFYGGSGKSDQQRQVEAQKVKR